MRTLKKNEMLGMDLGELALQREMLFSELDAKGTKRLRNALYELLGVMDYKKRLNSELILEFA